jgi:hypothetical protein
MARSLAFDELLGELRELTGRVVTLEIRDERDITLLVSEGELGRLENPGAGLWIFRLGGEPPPDHEHVRFIVASWTTVEIHKERVSDIEDISKGLGPTVDLRIKMVDGVSIGLWPAMPAEEQWTDRHEDNR